MRNITWALLLFFSAAFMQAHAAPATLSFLENKGQVTDQYHNHRSDIRFSLSALPGLNIFIGDGAIHYQFSKADESRQIISGRYRQAIKDQPKEPISYTMYRMDVELIGANKNAEVLTSEKQSYYENYYTAAIGVQGVQANTYDRITFRDIYPHIDWVLYTTGGQLEHEFIVHDGGNAADIRLRYGGCTDLRINTDGSLSAYAPQGEITEHTPVSYAADGSPISSHFVLKDNILSYDISKHNGEVHIDPILSWGTYYGGSADDRIVSVTSDRYNNAYVTGWSKSLSGVVTSGAYESTYAGSTAVVLAKFNVSGTIKWSTFYGGATYDEGFGVSVDSAGYVYVTGSATSTTGIATPGAYRTVYDNLSDGFLAKFDSTGGLRWATYLGMGATGIAIDKQSSAIYLTGTTAGTSIITLGTFGGAQDAFLSKFDNAGNYQWGTYFGGNDIENSSTLAIDNTGAIYITGSTISTTGIATAGAHQTIYAGTPSGYQIGDGYLAKFNGSGTLQWATYFGGSDYDWIKGVSTFANKVYVTGITYSTSGIATAGSYQPANGGGANAFLADFDDSGVLHWSTYFGRYTYGDDVATDSRGNAYITGFTASDTAIATPCTYQYVFGGGTGDNYIAKFDSMGALGWGTYYGGAGVEESYAIATDHLNGILIAGATTSTTAISTPGAYSVSYAGGTNTSGDGFLARFTDSSSTATSIAADTSVLCTGSTLTLTASAQGGTWTSSGPAIASVTNSGTISALSAGTDTIRYSLSGCGVATKIFSILATPPSAIFATGDSVFCQGDSALLHVTNTAGATYQWSENGNNITGANNDSYHAMQTGIYQADIVATNGCTALTTPIHITVNPIPTPLITQHADTLSTAIFDHYQWYMNNQPLSGDTLEQFIFAHQGTYQVRVSENGCVGQSSPLIIKSVGLTYVSSDVSAIYPNPFKDIVGIKDAKAIDAITVTDLQGRTVAKAFDQPYISLSQLPQGMYIISATDKAGNTVLTNKIVKQ